AQSILRRDLRATRESGAAQAPVDHLFEPWALPQPAFEIEQGRIQIRIEDLAGRFNLNSLVQNQQPNAAAQAQFRRLLLRLDITEPYAERLVDWLDADQQPSGEQGAEDNAYLLLDPPYRTAGRSLGDLSELRLLLDNTGPPAGGLGAWLCAAPQPRGELAAGDSASRRPGPPYRTAGRSLGDLSELRLLLDMHEEDFQRLAPYVSALPADVPLNVNTASALVLSTLGDNLSLSRSEERRVGKECRSRWQAEPDSESQ